MNNVFIKKDILSSFLKNIKNMSNKSALVGIPGDQKHGKTSNSELGFIHEFGSDHAHIPARPFLLPGIKKEKNRILEVFKNNLPKVLAGEDAHITFNKVGIIARDSIKNMLRNGPFAPLAEATIAARRRSRTSGKAGTKPLIDTGQLLNSINYVIK